MKLPYLSFLDTTPISINITDGIENGAPKVITTYSGLCRFSESCKVIKEQDGELIQLSAEIILGADIAPGIAKIEGTATINSVEYEIYHAARPQNPDNSINHTELQLIKAPVRQEIHVQYETVTYDTDGSELKNWPDFVVAQAQFVSQTGKEFFKMQQRWTETQAVLKIWYVAGINTTMRVKYDDRIFSIVGVEDIAEQHRELLIACKEVL